MTDRTSVLAELGLTPADVAIFNVLHYGIRVDPDHLATRAAFPDYSPAGPVTRSETEAAVAHGLAKGWLQIIDDTALARIADDLRASGYVGPVYRLPELGCVDFTLAGADLERRFAARCFPPRSLPYFTDGVHFKTARYCRTRSAALAVMRSEEEAGITAVGPAPIGPWRVQWWRRFPEGYRVDLDERSQWQGWGGRWGPRHFMHRQPVEPARLQDVLDRHNVTLTEWVLLAGVESDHYRPPSYFPRDAAGSAKLWFGLKLSREECLAGFDACLRNGWLRVADAGAVAEVRALLRDDPVFLPVPRAAGCSPGMIDFTTAGAALYRLTTAAAFGSDREDALSVEDVYYQEVHHYSESAEVLRGVASAAVAAGEPVRSAEIVPIGPWCVYWWERFPAGYRLEMRVGDPGG